MVSCIFEGGPLNNQEHFLGNNLTENETIEFHEGFKPENYMGAVYIGTVSLYRCIDRSSEGLTYSYEGSVEKVNTITIL